MTFSPSKADLERMFPRPKSPSKRQTWDAYIDVLASRDGALMLEEFEIVTPSRWHGLCGTWSPETGDLSIFCESDDGTTEVAATDSTIDATAGSAVANRVELWIDGRDPSDMKYYINGAEVLNATANLGNIAVAAGPLGLLFHLEKTTGTATAGPIYLDAARCRLMSQ